jgi:hypothetical protein
MLRHPEIHDTFRKILSERFLLGEHYSSINIKNVEFSRRDYSVNRDGCFHNCC